VQDETERRRQECFENDRRLVLEMVAQDQPLPAVLNQVVGLVERQMPGLRTSVMLLQDGMIRPFGASIPAQLADALARKPVSFVANLTSGPDELGAVRVAEVQSDAAWEGLRDEATAAGVACCWALTLRGNDAVPFGLLIVLAPEHREPTAAEALVLEIALHLGSVGIEHYQTTRQLAHLVRHDPLTGLPNRVLFEDRLHQALASARRHNRPLGLLALDLNRFKHVNDTLGHQAGDSLLQQFSMRLRSKLRESDTLARVGGDEFLVILPDVASRDEAEVVTQRLRDALACAPFEVGGQSLAATASIGIAMYPQDADDTAPLQRAADAAMYRAKEAGRRNEAHTLLSKSA
jgi:diguanylate cyclase (GGDEF)-like protein